ncbi:MAG: hypothetical protein IBJ14_01550 [Hydrogenophaga sp.]|nr:hypothetical protein [Hydrogenophaga sp.]
MNARIRWLGLLGVAAALQAHAQPASTPPMGASDTACTVHEHLPPAQLGGDWEAFFWPEGGSPERPTDRGHLRLERHPEYTAGVRGDLVRGSGGQMRASRVSGDVTEGAFHLDESNDGKAMSAVWSGQALDCGGRLTITGTRRPAEGSDSPDPVQAFRLQRFPGWR